MAYKSQHKIRIVTASSLFDGHDVSINIMRRVLQSKGVEVIHLGHNRSVNEIITCAIQEDVQGIAVSSYQGGHNEYFKYIYDLLKKHGYGYIKIFGGGGGTILPSEIAELHAYGITRIYSPDDGRAMGLEGMIDDMIKICDFDITKFKIHKNGLFYVDAARNISQLDLHKALQPSTKETKHIPVIGLTGTGGSGKSSVTDELVRRFIVGFPDKKIAIVSIDPSKKKTGGALLGDRIRMNSIYHPNIYMRSMATGTDGKSINENLKNVIQVLREDIFDLILIETAGIGQSDASIVDFVDFSIYVMTPEYGAASQLEKINMIDYADMIVINKFDKTGSLDSYHDVCKQYKRSRNLFHKKDEELPVYGTMASHFNDKGVNLLFETLCEMVAKKCNTDWLSTYSNKDHGYSSPAIRLASGDRYLSDIAKNNRNYDEWVKEQAGLASEWYKIEGALQYAPKSTELIEKKKDILTRLDNGCKLLIENWKEKYKQYNGEFYEYKVRNKNIKIPFQTTSLSGTKINKVYLPEYQDWGDILKWQLQENVPGEFPFTSGVFPIKRVNEDPTRMFAGEGTPERTNKRFHYLAFGQPAKRLSTAFDSVTLYGEDPHERPDIYGKVGNSGVNIPTINDAKKLYSGFELTNPTTSVSMTINGPAPIVLAFYLNAAIDQECEKYIRENGLIESVQQKIKDKYKGHVQPKYFGELPEGNDGLGLLLLGVTGDEVLEKSVYDKIKNDTLKKVRGTVQADILKEDQAQNTCIFSTEFSLRLMGDIQEYFIKKDVQNFYSVSISGYHIAEAGANPISQLAFTISNGFTLVEYYLSRGMKIDDISPNLSFFFSNGMDPEYSVIGRVARRIWAKAMRYKYHAKDERSQKLKYHIQTSGRSLHAQEIEFNDIRTTLQALYAIYDNCNSLHTNAYDEAITTPTEESVRRAMAIQLIINRELGEAKNENPLQGSFFMERLTDMVEEAVLQEFERISERGGVLGAMERMYQRSKIQDESMYYEMQKMDGTLPLVGINTFLNKDGSPTILPREVIRSTEEEKGMQISNVENFKKINQQRAEDQLKKLKEVAIQNKNVFHELMETAKVCTLAQITHCLYNVGGEYRRNI